MQSAARCSHRAFTIGIVEHRIYFYPATFLSCFTSGLRFYAGFFIWPDCCIFVGMAFVIVNNYPDNEAKELLRVINCKLDKLLSSANDDNIRQEIMDKLNATIADIKSTIKN